VKAFEYFDATHGGNEAGEFSSSGNGKVYEFGSHGNC